MNTQNWENEFDNTDLTHIIQTGHSIHGSSYSHQELDSTKVKQFISSLLKTQREEIIKEIDKSSYEFINLDGKSVEFIEIEKLKEIIKKVADKVK